MVIESFEIVSKALFENKLIISPFQKVEKKAEKSHFVLQSVNLFSNKP